LRTYRSTRNLLADVKKVLADNRPSFHRSPLEEIAGLLCEGRHYSWVGIYLTLDEKSSSALLEEALIKPNQVAVHGTRKKIVVAMRVGGRELGFLNVESDRESAFGSEDRVLLDRVAGLLARFLAGPRGKYLVLRAAKVPAVASQAKAA
jgi:putative methionine-R-sulfoxide reductase with GAF domain